MAVAKGRWRKEGRGRGGRGCRGRARDGAADDGVTERGGEDNTFITLAVPSRSLKKHRAHRRPPRRPSPYKQMVRTELGVEWLGFGQGCGWRRIYVGSGWPMCRAGGAGPTLFSFLFHFISFFLFLFLSFSSLKQFSISKYSNEKRYLRNHKMYVNSKK